jgi:VCBS repeat-containing protein
VEVLRITLTSSSSGDYTVEQLAPLDHPAGNDENNLQFAIQYRVTDGDGDTADGVLPIDVDDDTAELNNLQVLKFDEIALADGGERGLDFVSPDYGGFTWAQTGVHNPNGLGYAPASEPNLAFFGEANGELGLPEYPGAGGSPIIVKQSDGDDFTFIGAWFSATFQNDLDIVLQAFNNGVQVGGDHHISVDMGGPTFFDFSAISDFVDIDELRIDANDNIVSNYFGFDDFTFIANPHLVADEDDLPGGNGDAQPGDEVQQNLIGVLGFNPGADGATVSFAPLHATAVLDTSAAAVNSGGTALTYYVIGNTLYATTDTSSDGAAVSNAAFSIALNPATGAYTFTLLAGVDHSGPAGVESNVFIDVPYTVTDGDGDAVVGTLEVSIDDDINLTPNNGPDAVDNLVGAPAGAGWLLYADNNHYYQFVPESGDGFTWTEAQAAAAALGAYLATITDAGENAFAAALAPGGGGWLGGRDVDLNGSWFWVEGPETGTLFWNNGDVGAFTNWALGEPSNSTADEDGLHYFPAGFGRPTDSWNDLNDLDATGFTTGYIAEWGGRPGDALILKGVTSANLHEILLSNDTDPDVGDILDIVSVNTAGTAGTVLFDDGTDTLTYTPDAAAHLALGQGETLTDSFEYTISDGNGGTDTATATVVVHGIADPEMLFVLTGIPA